MVKTDSNGDTNWTREFTGIWSDIGKSVAQLSDNGYIIACDTSSFGANGQVRLIRTDSSGIMSWSQLYRDAPTDKCFSIINTSDGGFGVVGFASGDGIPTRSMLFIKTDGSGDTNFIRTFLIGQDDKGHDLVETSDGGYLIVGETFSSSDFSSDVYLARTDSNGNVLWEKKISVNKWDYGYAIEKTTDGGYLITGATESEDDNKEREVLIIKTDDMGNISP